MQRPDPKGTGARSRLDADTSLGSEHCEPTPRPPILQARPLGPGERTRLVALLSHAADSESSLPDLNTELAARIRDGSLSDKRDELVDHLRSTVRDKLAIANPKYVSS